LESIEASILNTKFIVDRTLTICIMTLHNGYTIVGKSACADPSNFQEDLGQRLSRADAVNQIWPLMGFELKARMYRDDRLVSEALVKPSGPREAYIGTKVINAQPMNRRNYNFLRGWSLPDNENGVDEGYLVEYTDRVENPSNCPGYAGYVSWSPKDVFERAYRRVRQVTAQPVAASATQAGERSPWELDPYPSDKGSIWERMR